MKTSRSIVLLLVAPAAGCAGIADDPSAAVDQHGGLELANARWIEGNAGPVEANANPIDANANPIDANARRVDGVTNRSLGINDHLANPLAGVPDAAQDAAARQGWYLPATTDLLVEGYPAGFTGFDRCLALDAGATTSGWRITPSTPVERDGQSYVESGFVELDDGAGGWTPAPVDTTLYLPATAARALAVMVDPAAVPETEQRPLLLKLRVLGALPVRDPTDLAAVTVDRDSGRMYRKQLVVASMCLPDPADAATASWVPIGAVTFGDAYGYDVAGSPETAGRGDGDGIRGLAPWLRFKGYIGRDPGDTSAKAEMYYTGGLVTRGDPDLEPHMECSDELHLPLPPMPGDPTPTPPDDPGDPAAPDGEVVPVAELNARIAMVFANAMDVPIAGDGGDTAIAGMTVNGTPIRVSLVTAPGCSLEVPAALAPHGTAAAVDWAPSLDELFAPYRMDSLNGPPIADDPEAVFRSRNSTACGLDDQRVNLWVAVAPADDGWDVPSRAALAALRTDRCGAVALRVDPTPALHRGRFVRWDGEPGGLLAAHDIGYWLTASPAGDLARCGDKIYDREFERGTCEQDHPFPIPHTEEIAIDAE